MIDNSGFRSIGALSRSIGDDGFGTRYVYTKNGHKRVTDELGYEVETLPVDLAMNARSLGAHVIECESYAEFVQALQDAKKIDKTTVLCVADDRYLSVPGYETWWDVPIAEVSERDTVQAAREEWEEMQTKERYFL